ncbi:MAG: Arm DNA-binding domain-containing protein, partial [Deltaproteobacteria bacterium]|nr:Arm DNA-binding domain-containing protein [Deltaproteobacteria bacterium]
MVVHKLTAKALESAKPKEKMYTLSDGGNLYLDVSPSGGKWWRLRYRFDGKPNRISLGTYPEVSLSEAREKARELKSGIAKGVDPVAKKKGVPQTACPTFEKVAREWWEKFFSHRDNGKYKAAVLRRLEMEVFPYIGSCEITKLTAPAILEVARKYEQAGKIETAHKIKSWISQTLDYAIACGLLYLNPARDLSKAL